MTRTEMDTLLKNFLETVRNDLNEQAEVYFDQQDLILKHLKRIGSDRLRE